HIGDPAVAFESGPPPRVTSIALENTARGEVAGMDARSVIEFAVLREGERARMIVELAPNECATFIAQGGLGAVGGGRFLTVGDRRSVRIVAQDANTGPIAVVGGKAGCYQNGAAKLVCELHARMRRGAGPVLVRGFRR